MGGETEKRIAKLALAVSMLSMAVADLARLCDTRGYVFDEESARRFDSQWDMCQEMLAEVLKEGDAEMNRLVYTEAEAIEAWNTRAEQTCHNTAYQDGCFACSECGNGLEDPRQEPNFVKWCPFCRAKVIDE